MTGIVHGQGSIVTAWKPADDTMKQQVYHPEPILFVHGINDDDGCWSTVAIPSLTNSFANYDLPRNVNRFIGAQTNYNAVQQPYLHTFNYGNYVKNNLPSWAQSFDHIEWNAWEDDMKNRAFTNKFLRSAETNITFDYYSKDSGRLLITNKTLSRDPDYYHAPTNDGRKTLNMRIGELRNAYISFTNKTKVVLVAHSMGGLVSHYYLCKCVATNRDSGVRRLVTLASPHCGSLMANDQYHDLVLDPVDRIARAAGYLTTTEWGRDAGNIFGKDWDETGFASYSAAGAVEDLTASCSTPPALAYANDLQNYFPANSVPAIEYVFNGFKMPFVTHYKMVGWSTKLANRNAWNSVTNGDGVVALPSAAGKPDSNSPSIFISQDPVLFETWTGDHTDAKQHLPSLLASLFGVPYYWPSAAETPRHPAQLRQPDYAKTYGENQSFSKYLNDFNTDEPGIGDLIVLCQGAQTNPLLINVLDTWARSDTAYPSNKFMARADLETHQIIGDSAASIRLLGTVGAKNHAQYPLGVAFTDTNALFWAEDGNEYQPASLALQFTRSTQPNIQATSPTTYQPNLISKCLTWLDTDGAPQYQYGLFDQTFSDAHPIPDNPYYYFVCGTNLAALATPVVERGFDVPVDSATVVHFSAASTSARLRRAWAKLAGLRGSASGSICPPTRARSR